MTGADMNCNCKGGHQQTEGEVPASPTTSNRTGWGMGGEGQQQEPEAPEAEEARTGRTDASTGFTDCTSAAILIENDQDDRARPREGSQPRRGLGGD